MNDCAGCLFTTYCGLSVATYRLVAAGYCKIYNEREKKNKADNKHKTE